MQQIPWGHNLQLIFKLKDPARRLWYAQRAVEHGWSRAVLVHQIKSGLYERQGGAVTNFDAALPPDQSDLAKQAIKDPYVFDFLTMSADAAEDDLEKVGTLSPQFQVQAGQVLPRTSWSTSRPARQEE